MRARVRKWGNSLALRIPKSVAEETFLSDDSLVDIKVVSGKIVVAPVAEPGVNLEKLLSDVDERNLHWDASVETVEESGE